MALNEVMIFQGLHQHKNVIKVSDCYTFEEKGIRGNITYFLIIVMEEAETSLEAIIKERSKNQQLIQQYRSRSYFRKICMDLCQGLAFYSRCQKKKIYHSDIKPANIFRSKGSYLVADFGTAQVTTSLQPLLLLSSSTRERSIYILCWRTQVFISFGEL